MEKVIEFVVEMRTEVLCDLIGAYDLIEWVVQVMDGVAKDHDLGLGLNPRASLGL